MLLRTAQDKNASAPGTKLFDDQTRRHDPTPKGNSESEFHFLNRVDTPYWTQVRTLLNEWFERFPEEHRPDLLGRFQSQDDGQFRSAFWELYLHESLARQGYRVTVHPTISNNMAKPDFLAESDDLSFYMEATTAARLDFDSPLSGQLKDAIRAIRTSNFFVDVHIETQGDDLPSLNQLQRDISAWLSGLDPDEVTRQIVSVGGIYFFDALVWESKGWRIELRPIPRSRDARGRPGMDTLGSSSSGAPRLVDTSERVLGALRHKAKRYGDLPAPYVIAVYTLDPFATAHHIESALVGTLTSTGRTSGGFWHGGRHAGVAAVLTEVPFNPMEAALAPWTVGRCQLALWHNPTAAQPLGAQLPWRTVRFQADLVEWSVNEPEAKPNDLFGLPLVWPVGEPFERQA